MQRSYTKSKKATDDSYQLGLTMPVSQSLDEVWAALVKPENLARWLMPVSGNLAKGGAFAFGNVARGQVAICEPKRRLGLAWQQAAAQTMLDVSFATVGKGKAKQNLITLMVTAKLSDVPQASWDAYGPAALGIGWEWVMRSLATYLEDPTAAPMTIMAFSQSSEGQTFVTHALAAWRALANEKGISGPVPSLLAFYNGLPA